MADILALHVKPDYDEVSHLTDQQRANAPPHPPTPGPYRRKHLVQRSMPGRCLKHAGR